MLNIDSMLEIFYFTLLFSFSNWLLYDPKGKTTKHRTNGANLKPLPDETALRDNHHPDNGTANGGFSNGNGKPHGTAGTDNHHETALRDNHHPDNGTANGGFSNGNGKPHGTAGTDNHHPDNGIANGEVNGVIANLVASLQAPETKRGRRRDEYQGGTSLQTETSALKLPGGETLQVLTPPAAKKAEFDKKIINEALHSARVAVGVKIQEFIDKKRGGIGSYEPLYEMLADYPFRTGKMLRPTMCVSMARAVGGMGQSALTTAAALELYHNAFLIHDDIEDGSEARRGKETLHHIIGIPRAINVGDATNVLAVGMLLENLSLIGANKTLDVLHEIELMAQQSVEGQAMELDWVATNASNLTDQDYFKMCVKKTCWYSFMTPCRIGLIVGHPSAHTKDLVEPLALVTRFGMVLGIAFQIQDDLLNLQGDVKLYGKEIGGDIYEGKRTLMLNHTLAHSSAADSQKIREILARKKPQHKWSLFTTGCSGTAVSIAAGMWRGLWRTKLLRFLSRWTFSSGKLLCAPANKGCPPSTIAASSRN